METTLTFDSIERFQESLLAKGRSMNTAKAYKTDLKEMMRHFKVEEIPLEDLESVAASWLNQTRGMAAPRTTARRIASLRAYAKWALRSDILFDYSAPKPKRPVPHPIQEGISGVIRMCNSARNPSEAALFALQGLMGLRVGEALSLTAQDFNKRDMTLLVRGKGDKERDFPFQKWHGVTLSQPTCSHFPPGVPWWTCQTERRAPCHGYRAAAWLRFPHQESRPAGHTCDRALPCSLDLRTTQEVLGHANSRTTEMYTQVNMENMRAGLDSLGE
jgi:integrase/recombinase XerD